MVLFCDITFRISVIKFLVYQCHVIIFSHWCFVYWYTNQWPRPVLKFYDHNLYFNDSGLYCINMILANLALSRSVNYAVN